VEHCERPYLADVDLIITMGLAHCSAEHPHYLRKGFEEHSSTFSCADVWLVVFHGISQNSLMLQLLAPASIFQKPEMSRRIMLD
jgi:hypothetical protein